MQETEVIAKADDVRVRIMALSRREIADWHYHTQIADNVFCLNGIANYCKLCLTAHGENGILKENLYQQDGISDLVTGVCCLWNNMPNPFTKSFQKRSYAR